MPSQIYGLTPSKAGFTLVEMVIASGLMALILASAYACLNAGLVSQKLIEPRAEVIQNARVALALIAADLRSACPLSKDFDFLGVHRMLNEVEADNLDFATHHYSPKKPREADYCQESLYLDRDPETGHYILWRRRNPLIALDPLTGGTKEEIARGIRGAKFEYFDGLDWYDSWGEIKSGKQETSRKVRSNLSGMPDAVRITLRFDPEPPARKTRAPGETPTEPPLVFQTTVRLELAAASRRSSSSGSGSDSSAQAAGNPGTPGGGAQ